MDMPDFESEMDARFGKGGWHCDDLADGGTLPRPVTEFLAVARAPAHGLGMKRPALFATHEGKRVRVTMASRLGDVGVNEDLNATQGYTARCLLPALTDFGDKP